MLEGRLRLPNCRGTRGTLLAACLFVLSGCNVPEPPPEALVAAPANLVAKGGDAVVILDWTARAGATGYNLKRGVTNGGPYAQLVSLASNGYTDSSVANGTTYYYVVTSLDSSGESANSGQVAVTPAAPTAPPPAPTNLAAVSGNAQVSLTWSASNTAVGYRVKRATISGGPYTLVASPTLVSYIDTAVTNDTSYYYVVSAVNSVGEGANSAQVSAMPVISNPPPTTFGTWTNVTPAGVDLTTALCGNTGSRTIQVDAAHPSNLYTTFDCQGVWKSVDYGATWTGPINTGSNGAVVGDCSGGIAIPPGSTAAVPTIYQACVRGNALGFWRSVDGGVNWIRYVVGSSAARQDYSALSIDPYDGNHLLMTGHEFDSIVESRDGGQTWTSVPLANGMMQTALDSTIFFVNTGSASTTRGTWLWMGNPSGGAFGTWRTTNSGTNWIQVDKSEGVAQLYQPDSSGIIFVAGSYSASGPGVLRSKDYGQTWTHVGLNKNESVVFGTSKNVYSMVGSAIGPGGVVDPSFQVGAQPGTGTWVAPGTAPGLTQGPAQVAIVNDGTHNIFLGAMFNAGMWRYVEP